MALQRQTVVSQFYQIDKLVVEGGKSVCGERLINDPGEEGANGSQGKQTTKQVQEGEIIRQKDVG